jgi:N-acetylglucosaminyldiphosphoundecaprenol N-acetyl-beta-D-mannosaminyltransferase
MSRFFLGPVPIDPVTRSEALDRIAGLVAARDGGTVFTPNVDHVVLADEVDAFREAYAAASLSLVDGMPLLWAARLLGHAVPEKVSGSDLLKPLVERAANERWRVYLFGGAPGVAERAAAKLTFEFPGLRIAGADGPQVDLSAPREARMEAVRRIQGSRPDLVLVALGGFKAELWSFEMAEALRPAVLVGVGAALDFVTGAQRRAPAWMSSAGLEWLHRLASDPRRLARRYLLRDPKFAPLVLRLLWDALARGRRTGLAG